ncbi:MAG: TetR/AcrR family transcriptional regulator [Bauldia sp.]
MSERTKERRQELHDALLAAAERTIADSGLAGLRARDLAASVGCATGAIYNVFPDLDSLILEVNARTLAGLEGHLGGHTASAKRATRIGAGDQLVELGVRYLEFATNNLLRWRTLFDHRMPPGQAVPTWYMERQQPLFGIVERTLQALQPSLSPKERSLLSRSLFSAVHGIVSLGLEEKLGALPLATLKSQLATLIRAFSAGIAQKRS